jgi:hypothetical protein
MKGLFKRLGHGFLFILVVPFWIMTFVLFSVYAIVSYIFTFFTAIPAYFRGESVFGPSELDIAASTRLAEQKLQAQMPPPAPIVQPSTTIIFNAPPPQGQADPRINYIQQDGTIYRQVTAQDVQKIPTDVIVEEEKK